MFRDESFEIKLRNAAGVPVLHFGGNVSKHALNALRFTLDRLANAGHYHIVLNIEKVQASSLEFLNVLADSVSNVKKHYGAVDLVATQERIQQLLGIERIARLFRLSTSESQAIRRIKRLARQPHDSPETNARLLERK